MILGVGTDLANIERIQGTLDRFGDRFRNRVFTQVEQQKAERRRDIAGSRAYNVKNTLTVASCPIGACTGMALLDSR